MRILSYLLLLPGLLLAQDRPVTDQLWGPVSDIEVSRGHLEVLTWAGRVPVRFTTRTLFAERETFEEFSFADASGEDVSFTAERSVDGGWRAIRAQIYPTTNRFVHHLPNDRSPSFCGRLTSAKGPVATLDINGTIFTFDCEANPMPIHVYRRIQRTEIRPGIDSVEVQGAITEKGQVDAYFVGIYKEPHDFRPKDDPALPRVLLIGDSMSSQYFWPLRKRLAGKVNLYRIDGQGGTSANGVEQVYRWLGPYWEAPWEWDLILYNFGLHDLRKTDRPARSWVIPPKSYKTNLRTITERLAATGAELMWIETSPVPGEPGTHTYFRDPGDARIYNAAADQVLGPDIHRCAMWRFMKDPAFDAWHATRDVHVPDKLKDMQAELLETEILKVLSAAKE